MRIACIGNAVYDITVSSNKPLVEGVRNSFSGAGFTAGGPASNAASVIARYGSPVDFYGRVGNDLNGQYVYNKMQSENINLEHLYVSNEVMTPFSFVILNTSADTRTICTVRDEIESALSNAEEKLADVVKRLTYANIKSNLQPENTKKVIIEGAFYEL